VRPDRTATLVCEDGNYNAVYNQKIPFTDFPLDTVSLWFANGVIYLPASTDIRDAVPSHSARHFALGSVAQELAGERRAGGFIAPRQPLRHTLQNRAAFAPDFLPFFSTSVIRYALRRLRRVSSPRVSRCFYGQERTPPTTLDCAPVGW
jgi:Family of unknown function (DUF6876)